MPSRSQSLSGLPARQGSGYSVGSLGQHLQAEWQPQSLWQLLQPQLSWQLEPHEPHLFPQLLQEPHLLPQLLHLLQPHELHLGLQVLHVLQVLRGLAQVLQALLPQRSQQLAHLDAQPQEPQLANAAPVPSRMLRPSTRAAMPISLVIQSPQRLI